MRGLVALARNTENEVIILSTVLKIVHEIAQVIIFQCERLTRITGTLSSLTLSTRAFDLVHLLLKNQNVTSLANNTYITNLLQVYMIAIQVTRTW